MKLARSGISPNDSLNGQYFTVFCSTQANIKIDKEPLEGALKVLNTLYDGWVEAIKSLKKQPRQGEK